MLLRVKVSAVLSKTEVYSESIFFFSCITYKFSINNSGCARVDFFIYLYMSHKEYIISIYENKELIR